MLKLKIFFILAFLNILSSAKTMYSGSSEDFNDDEGAVSFSELNSKEIQNLHDSISKKYDEKNLKQDLVYIYF